MSGPISYLCAPYMYSWRGEGKLYILPLYLGVMGHYHVTWEP